MPLLSLLIWFPVLGGVTLLVLSRTQSDKRIRQLGLLISVLTFALSIPLFTAFDTGTAAMQFTERLAWIPAYQVYYHLGIDGLSMPLIVLTTFTTVLVVLAGWEVIQKRVAQYLACFLIMEGLMIGVFAALDAILFYFFWEAMLVPMFLVIGIWGGPRRVYAAIKFFLYTFLGSVLLLVGIFYLYFQSNSFGILDFQQAPISMTAQTLLFFGFLLAFAVKVPMWPVHTWLPDAHVEAPTGGSVILAAIMLKLGAYGLLRFILPVLPDASAAYAGLIIFMSLVAVVYIALVALVQEDMKKLVAYSSISHMGFVTLGFFVVFAIFARTGNVEGAALGMEGALVQMVSHGFIAGAMFLCIGVMYDRLHSRNIADYGGVVNSMPWFAALMTLFAMANVGLPGTAGFVGEFMVILSAAQANFWYAFLAALTLIFGAAYTLWMVKRVLFGAVVHDKVAQLQDLNPREFWILGILAAAVLILGLYPGPLLEVMHASVDQLLQQATTSKL